MRAGTNRDLDRDLMSLRAETTRWLVAGLFLAVAAMVLIMALATGPLPGGGGRGVCRPAIASQPLAKAAP